MNGLSLLKFSSTAFVLILLLFPLVSNTKIILSKLDGSKTTVICLIITCFLIGGFFVRLLYRIQQITGGQ